MAELSKLKSKNSWNKTDLTILLANQANIPKVRAAHYINILTTTISEALEKGKKVTISDFGTFQVSERRSFNGRNPKNGAPIIVPVRRIPVFRAGKKLKSSLNIPQLKDCVLVDSKKVRLTFTKLMDSSNRTLTSKGSYSILLDGQSIGKLVSVKADPQEKEPRPNTNEVQRYVKGVRSVVITCPKPLRGSSISVRFLKPLRDVDGNEVEVGD